MGNDVKNPPAFPCKVPLHPVECGSNKMVMGDMPGMTLRDYFAAAALQGILTNGMYSPDVTDINASTSYAAYQFADAMLKQRNAV